MAWLLRQIKFFGVVVWALSLPLFASCDFNPTVAKDNQAKISEIVSTVAHTRALFLWGKEKHLKKLGDELNKEVNFFQFWGFVFSTPKLANDMKLIKGSSMKYNPFISGGRPEILAEYKKDNSCFLKQCEGLAEYLKLDPAKTVEIFKQGVEALETQNTGLKPFFNYLIEEKNKS